MSHSIEAMRERAALYAAGALAEEEQRELEAHLATGCNVCQAEIDAFATVGALLGESVPQRRPRPELRRRVQDAIAQLGDSEGVTERDGIRVVHGQQIPWEQRDAAGMIHIKRLNYDAKRGYRSTLVRLSAGGAYPRHRHADVEEVYLIEGDLKVNGVPMQPGDYCRAEPGSIHAGVTTENGCTFVVLSCERDEFLAD